MKIVYCINSIRTLGGVERVTVVKANALAEIPGNEVYIAVLDDKKGEYVHLPSAKVKVVDLDAVFFPKGMPGSKVSYVLQIRKKSREYFLKLSAFLHRLCPDVVVSVGHTEFYVLPKIKGPWKLVREQHLASNYRRRLCRGESLFRHITALYGYLMDKHYYPKYDRIVTLTEDDRQKYWRHCSKVAVIPNPVSFICDKTAELTAKRIVSVGRLAPVKQFDVLIKAFYIVHQAHPDWTLEIVGDGELKQELLQLIHELSLDDSVSLLGRRSDVEQILLNSSIFAFSSSFEGFGLVLLEAMECGLPVVSTDCQYGPNEIVTEGVDGFLTPVGDIEYMAKVLCYLIENEDIRIEMGGVNAKLKASQYHPSALALRWTHFFRKLIDE